MSRGILIKGIYRNNKSESIGIFNPVNSDFFQSRFTNRHANDLVKRSGKFNKGLKEGKFKRIEIIITCSYKDSKNPKNFHKKLSYTSDFPPEIGLNWASELIEVVNNI